MDGKKFAEKVIKISSAKKETNSLGQISGIRRKSVHFANTLSKCKMIDTNNSDLLNRICSRSARGAHSSIRLIAELTISPQTSAIGAMGRKWAFILEHLRTFAYPRARTSWQPHARVCADLDSHIRNN